MRTTLDKRIADLCALLRELDEADRVLRQRRSATDDERALFELLDYELCFDILSNNSRDARLFTDLGFGFADREEAPPHLAPFVPLLVAANDLWAYNECDPATFDEMLQAVTMARAELGSLIVNVLRGSVTLLPFVEGAELAAIEAAEDAALAAAAQLAAEGAGEVTP
jgi:hypothetical protein